METRSPRSTTRVRFKTSCTECQRRRKKCNKGRPCSNCTRRYPPVDCIYENQKSQSCGIAAAHIAPSSEWFTLHNQKQLVNRLSGQGDSLPGLASLNLPSLIPRRLPTLAMPDIIQSRAMLQGQQKALIKIEDAKPEDEPPFRDLEKIPCYSTVSPLDTVQYGASQLLSDLSVEPTGSNAQLFHIYFKGILPALWSADGTSPAPPIINEFWIPFMTSSPIILHANLLRAAIWRMSKRSQASEICAHEISSQNQWAGNKETLEILTLKSKAISLLNARLRSPGGKSVDNEAITSVIFFFYNEWCWGVKDSFDDLNPHARGLREMLRIRGGIKNINSQGHFLHSFVMLMNYHMAAILERELFLCPRSDHDLSYKSDYLSPIEGLDSPLYAPNGSLKEIAPSWGLDHTTIQIIKDMTSITEFIHIWMSTNYPEFERHQWLLKLSHIQSGLSSLPPISLVDSPSQESLIYECCRVTAIVYSRAILDYTPFSEACTPSDLDRIYTSMSLVPIKRWMRISGTWLWTLCVANPAARYRYEGLRLRMFLKNCTSALALIDWQIMVNCMDNFLIVQNWIRERGRKATSDVEIL